MEADERSKVVQEMQKDVENFISHLKPKKYEDGWPEDRWEEEMEKHPIFMSKPIEEGQDLPPLVEAIQQLKYDPDINSPEELAKSYKEDGNQNFKHKKYRWAVESYTQGLEAKCDNNELNAQLFTNRAASEYHIGNYKKSLNDIKKARSLKPNHIKAIERGALCYYELQLYEDCISWCDEGLNIEPNKESLITLKNKAQESKKILDRDKRKAAVLEAKKKKEIEALKKALEERSINFVGDLDLEEIEPMHPALVGSKVHLDNEGAIIWPVIFLYPEYGLTDYIQKFHEDSCLIEHLNIMFNEDNIPSWDQEHKYSANNIQVYFSNNDILIEVDKFQSLKSILSDERYIVHGGTPSFIITVKDSKFDKDFRIKNGLTS